MGFRETAIFLISLGRLSTSLDTKHREQDETANSQSRDVFKVLALLGMKDKRVAWHDIYSDANFSFCYETLLTKHNPFYRHFELNRRQNTK